MREINLFESLCLYRNLAACQLFSFNVLCVEHRQAGMLLYSSFFWSLSLSANILLYGFRDEGRIYYLYDSNHYLMCVCATFLSFKGFFKIFLSFKGDFLCREEIF